ncbi:hypothetical protein GGR04_004473 [Aureimonas pseudogalii]|uniref:Uncharacterized protein n=1 Tax=Aureimonas pseudogalii TaxID=1744844 RepID=A0A7W6H8J7_9HYPH|nr:hypothetical protein [Aureimonas pseudogalii]
MTTPSAALCLKRAFDTTMRQFQSVKLRVD